MQTPSKIFGANLKTLRLNHNLSQEKLCAKMNILGSSMPLITYRYIETGSCNIKVTDLAILQTIYKNSYDDFFINLHPSNLSKKFVTMLLTNPTFGNNLASLRISHGYTQKQLTEEMKKLGVSISRATYANIECNIRNLKSTDLVCLKMIYGVPYEEFFKNLLS